jgi:chromodomain-helicase-DNA-binding protein 7
VNAVALKHLLHGRVPLSADGSEDRRKSNEMCDFTDRTDEQMKRLASSVIGVEDVDDHQADGIDGNDDRSHGANEGRIDWSAPPTPALAFRLLDSLAQLRRAFVKYSEEGMSEYFSYIPRWPKMPTRWTNHMEFVFFRELCERGIEVRPEILRMPEFNDVFRSEPPPCLSRNVRVLPRLNYVLDFIERNELETLRTGKELRRRKKKHIMHGLDLMPTPEIAYDDHGAPVLPMHIGLTALLLDLGHIVTDRPGFHNERYIFPAGFKSSRLCFSTIDPTEKVRYTSEILDTGGEQPLFRVTMDDHPEISFEGNTPSFPWNLIAKRLLEGRPGDGRTSKMTGTEYFGLHSPAVCYVIQHMEGADKCVNYVMRPFERRVPESFARLYARRV